MNCREGELLISPLLNEDLINDMKADLSTHLADCEACAREMALQKRISLSMKEIGLNEIQAPAGLCEMVMGNIRSERRTFISRLPVAWRKTVAAAAALLLLAGGSLSITFKMLDTGKLLVLGPSPQTSVEPSVTVNPESKENSLGEESSATLQGQLTTKVPNDDQNLSAIFENKPASPGVPEAVVSGLNAQTSGGNVLLSNKMVMTSTVLTYDVDDLTEAKIKAVALAAGAGAATQVFPEQGNDKRVVVLRLTIDSDQAPDLIAEFTSMGRLTDRHDESQDITSLYNETLVQYNDLKSRIALASNAGEQKELATQAYSYQQRLDTWSAEDGKRVITLWLESL